MNKYHITYRINGMDCELGYCFSYAESLPLDFSEIVGRTFVHRVFCRDMRFGEPSNARLALEEKNIYKVHKSIAPTNRLNYLSWLQTDLNACKKLYRFYDEINYNGNIVYICINSFYANMENFNEYFTTHHNGCADNYVTHEFFKI